MSEDCLSRFLASSAAPLLVSIAGYPKGCVLGEMVLVTFAYKDVGKGREQDAEALPKQK